MNAGERADWRKKANRLLERFGIELLDCTDDGKPAEEWYYEDPQAFVDYVVDKYDLTPLSEPRW